MQMPSEGTVGQIRKAAADPDSRLAQLVAQDSGLRAGRETLTDFLDDYEKFRKNQQRAEKDVYSAAMNALGAHNKKEHKQANTAIAKAKARKQDADAGIASLRPHMVTLAQLSSYLSLRERFSAGRNRILIAALAAAAFLVLFAWATNPPKPNATAVSAVPQNPSAARLLLNSTGINELRGILGSACTASAGTPAGIRVIALSSTNGIFDLVVLPEGSCTKPARVTIPPNLGQVSSTSSVSVARPPTIKKIRATTAAIGAAITIAITATGQPAPALTESGSLPAGLSFIDRGNGKAAIVGTPAAGSSGSYPVTITASNADGTITHKFTLTVSR